MSDSKQISQSELAYINGQARKLYKKLDGLDARDRFAVIQVMMQTFLCMEIKEERQMIVLKGVTDSLAFAIKIHSTTAER